MTADTQTPQLTDRELLEQVHAVVTALAPLVAHVPRLMALLDPGAAMRRHLPGGRRAVP